MAVYCQLCGQAIAGPAHSGQNLAFRHPRWPPELSMRVCPTCQQTKPRCRECGLPMAAASPQGLCPTCAVLRPVCLACTQPILGPFYEFDGVGPYCPDCYQNRPRCDVCSAPLTLEHWQLSDGRKVCGLCHQTAIYAPADALALYEEMKNLAAARLGLVLNIPTGLALVDRNQIGGVIRRQTQPTRPTDLAPRRGQTDPPTAGPETLALDPQRTLGLYARRGMRRGLYVQTGLPRLLFLQVAAHEYAHAWQGENCPLLKDVLIHEGFAEWVAYRVIGYYGYALGQQRMLAREDQYGAGLRWALETENRLGVAGVIEACRRVD